MGAESDGVGGTSDAERREVRDTGVFGREWRWKEFRGGWPIVLNESRSHFGGFGPRQMAVQTLRVLPALAHTSSLGTDLTRNTRAPHFTPQHWLLCHMGLYWFEFEFEFYMSMTGVSRSPIPPLSTLTSRATHAQCREVRYGRARVCKALGWVGVGVKPIRACSSSSSRISTRMDRRSSAMATWAYTQQRRSHAGRHNVR